MKRILSLLVSASVCTVLMGPSFVFAQVIEGNLPDSGTDTIVERSGDAGIGDTATVETEIVSLNLQSIEPILVQLPRDHHDVFAGPYVYDVNVRIPVIPLQPLCNPCDIIKMELEAKKADLKQLEATKKDLNVQWLGAEQAVNDAQQKVNDLQNQLDRLQNPRSWARSGDIYRDSADLEVQRDWTREQWERYQNGDITAQELEDIWEEGLSDAEREKRKQDKIADTKSQLSDAERELNDAKQQKKDIEKKQVDNAAEMQKCAKEVEDLMRKLEDCLKKCQQGTAVNLPQNYGFGQPSGGFWDWLFGGDDEPEDESAGDLGLPPLEQPPFYPLPWDLPGGLGGELDALGQAIRDAAESTGSAVVDAFNAAQWPECEKSASALNPRKRKSSASSRSWRPSLQSTKLLAKRLTMLSRSSMRPRMHSMHS